MSKELKILTIAVLIFLSFFAYGSIKKEYARISTRVETTQAKVDSLADELQATTATIHAAIRSITDRFLAGQETSDIVKADILKAAIDKINDANSTTPTVPTIVMHSGYSCGPCNAWISTRMPAYIRQGWRVEVVKELDSARAWPWYEITDADGTQFQVDGPLDNAKFQAAKAGIK